MRFTFRHPALVRAVPPGCRTLKNVLVMMDGEVDIPEVQREDAPVACEFRIADRSYRYRYLDGEFYVAAGWIEHEHAGGHALPADAVAMIERDILSDMEAGIGVNDLAFRPGRVAWKIESAWNTRGDQLFPSEDFRLEGSPNIAMRVQYDTSVLVDVHWNDLDLWTERARISASRSFLLDGCVWTRAAEPLLKVRRRGASFDQFCDFDFYGKRFARLPSQPRPFGPKAEPQSGYWQNELNIYPLSEHARAVDEMRLSQPLTWAAPYFSVELADLENVSVSMPEVFGSDHAGLELDRQARIALHECTFLVHTGRWLPAVPRDAQRAYAHLKAIVVGHGRADGVADGVDVALERLVACLNGPGSRGPGSVFLGMTQSAAFRATVERVIADWRARPISLDIAAPRTPGGPPR